MNDQHRDANRIFYRLSGIICTNMHPYSVSLEVLCADGIVVKGIIPAHSTYRVETNGLISVWTEKPHLINPALIPGVEY